MNRFLLVIGLLGVCFSTEVWAQLAITSPQARIVYQRNQQNEASIPITGICPGNATRVDARVEIVPGAQGISTNWVQIDGNPQNGTFQGNLTAKGGWYRLFVRVFAGGSIIAESILDRVGVGEVFIIAGQSNAQGGHQPTPGASDDRVSCVDYADGDLTESNFPTYFLAKPMLVGRLGHITHCIFGVCWVIVWFGGYRCRCYFMGLHMVVLIAKYGKFRPTGKILAGNPASY